MWSNISKGKNWSGMFINKRKNGELFYEKAQMSPLYENGKHIGYLAIKEDITEQEENKIRIEKLNIQLRQNLDELHAAYEELNTINETLKQEREQFLSLLNSIPEPIFVTEKNTNIILFANNKINELVSRNIIGERCYKVLQNKNGQCDFCNSQEAIDEKKTCYWEHFNEKLNKHFYIIDRHITWLEGEDAHFQLSIDITKRKEFENKLKQTQLDLQNHRDQLLELIATKDKFFSIISHDLKNPFSSIMGLAEMLKEKAGNMDKETIIRFAGHISQASHNSYKLLQNLLEWSRSQMGKMNFELGNYNLKKLTEEVIELLYSQAKNKDISIELNSSTDLLIHADYNMLSTILRNLISNAIKFSPKGKSIVITASNRDSFTEIKVIDHGKGMSEKIRNNLFKISEKVTTPGTEDEKGTGLGLLLCKEFIDKHGGTIEVESEINKGSTFIVKLPATHEVG